ncbi:MAG: CDP-glucose 4,6-dehydratase [Candidatus Methanoperedens sp.]|nr:CDP-glucose 4,6-dehydratase [Candidatus Methanoperedens sp.]CAG0969554.1 CDP-glucose 4,6-dehydratase [Methanosarcinales archaeon]
MISLFGDIYRKKKVLVTGNTGFKGSWLSAWLLKLGADVYGLSNGIPTEPSHFAATNLKDRITYVEKDICFLEDVEKVIKDIMPDFVFHLAAQSLVRVSYSDPALTINTNVIGTMNMLEALRKVNNPCHAVMITSDKCYDNVEWIWGYRETDALGGKDPYSASKGAAELVIKTYANSFFGKEESNIKVTSVRAGNVIGGGDWAKDRIVPDCMRAWSEGKPVVVRNHNATRPWQHVLEPLSGYLRVGQKLFEDPVLNGEPFNFGPPADQNYSVGELIAQMQQLWQDSKVDVKKHPDKNEKEATLLKLCCDKALHILGWKANLNFQETVKFTVDWYKTYYEQKDDVFNMTCDQIEGYVRMAQDRNLVWVNGND